MEAHGHQGVLRGYGWVPVCGGAWLYCRGSLRQCKEKVWKRLVTMHHALGRNDGAAGWAACSRVCCAAFGSLARCLELMSRHASPLKPSLSIPRPPIHLLCPFQVTFVPPGFTRKPPKYERFIRPTGLRMNKAHVTHPELKATFQVGGWVAGWQSGRKVAAVPKGLQLRTPSAPTVFLFLFPAPPTACPLLTTVFLTAHLYSLQLEIIGVKKNPNGQAYTGLGVVTKGAPAALTECCLLWCWSRLEVAVVLAASRVLAHMQIVVERCPPALPVVQLTGGRLHP